MSLDSKQIKQIESDVESARITLNNLQHELVDHICCEVEHAMQTGKSFEDAYTKIKEQTGIKVLQKIQENTLYLIDKNYALMKTTMKITGNVSLALIAIGTVIKIYHWPGASIILMLGFTLLCFIFFPAAIYLNYTYKSEKRKPLLHLSILLGGITFMLGIFFKVMHWPGSAALLFFGWSVILLIFLPLLLFSKLKEVNTSGEKLIYALGILSLIIFEFATMFKMFHWQGAAVLMLLGGVMLIVLFLPLFTRMKMKQNVLSIGQFIFMITLSMFAVVLTYLLSMNVTTPVLECFTKEESTTGKIVNYFEKKRVKQLEMAKLNTDTLNKLSPERIAISESSAKVQNLILDIKLSLIQEINGINKTTALKYIENPDLIDMKDNYDLVNRILLGNSGNKLLASLKDELVVFRKSTSAITSSNLQLSESIEKLFDTSNKTIYDESKSWEEANFRNVLLIGALARLSEIDKNVRMVESSITKK